MKILILDDNLQYVDWIKDYILAKYPKAEITLTDRYVRAVNIVNRIKPDLIVTDICIGIVPKRIENVPNEWGGIIFIDYIRTVRNWPKEEVPIITYTASCDIKLIRLIEKYDAVFGFKGWADSFKDDLNGLLEKISKTEN